MTHIDELEWKHKTNEKLNKIATDQIYKSCTNCIRDTSRRRLFELMRLSTDGLNMLLNYNHDERGHPPGLLNDPCIPNILLKVILKPNKHNIESVICETQSAFMTGKRYQGRNLTPQNNNGERHLGVGRIHISVSLIMKRLSTESTT